MRNRNLKPNSGGAGKFPEKAKGCRSKLAKKRYSVAGMLVEYEKSQQTAGIDWNPLRSLIEGYRGLVDLDAAIKCAALAEDLIGESYRKRLDEKVKRHGHQRRIKRVPMEQARRIFSAKSNIKKLNSCKSFEEIYDLVAKNCEQISGLGPLYIYDTSLRIGAFLNKLPRRVYLQAGALIGACNLELDVKNSPLPISAFPEWMQKMTAHEIEDFLCIYKDRLGKNML